MKIHEKYIKRCIEIGKNGLGNTAPNPMVGCVLVVNNQIISEGFTSPFGGSHAEVNAINNVKDKSLLKKATLYVTLEPCSHHGKTPPCADLIVAHNIPEVVIGCIDSNPKVGGKGIQKLRGHGINVVVGVMEKECRHHHRRFFTYHEKKRPYIILKWAQSEDGFIAPITRVEREPVWITNRYSRQLVHKWRAEEQAILVGANTVLQDNPSLTTREVGGKNPIRVVIDIRGNLSKDSNVFDDSSKTVILDHISLDKNQPLATQICARLHEQSINSVIVEGGTKTLQLFIDEGLWDESRVFTGPITLHKGVACPTFEGKLYDERKINSDILRTYIND